MPPMAYQAPVPVPLPTYNWAASNQMWEFCLFKCQLETWTCNHKIKAEEKLDYLLSILGKEGYAILDRWVQADEAHKNDPTKFLDYTESMLDDKISPQVHVYKLEDITKRSDKSINELVYWICQCGPLGIDQWWQWCCNRIWSSMQADSGNSRCQHWAVQTTSEGQLWQEGVTPAQDLKNLLCCRVWSSAMCVEHVVHAVCHAHQTHDPKPLTSYTPCPNCTHQHPPSRNNCPAHDSACKGCEKKGHWQVKCQSCNTTSLPASHCQPHLKNHEKEREPQADKAKTEKRSPHKDLFIAAMDCGTVGDVHPKEMIIDNFSSQQCNEGIHSHQNCLQAPASKATASVLVKIDTGSGGNILPLCLFQTAASKTNQPRWPAYWPGPHMNQANCLQWVSDSPVWNPPWPHPLATQTLLKPNHT